MKHLRIFAMAVVVGFVASGIETVSGGAANSVAGHQRGIVRLAYPVAFLYLAPGQSDARLTFELTDTNDYKGPDTLTVSVWGPFGRFVRNMVVPDDGISTPTRKRTGPRRISVEFTADSPGIYQIRMEGTPDLRVRPVLSSPKRGTDMGRLALWARRIFWMTPPHKLYVLSLASATARIAVMAFHREPIRILVLDGKGERLTSLERRPDARTAATEFNVREQQLFELRLSGETFRMEFAGVEPMLCFAPEDARAFHQARMRESNAATERAASQKPESRALDAVQCGEDDSERAHEMTERASTLVKRQGRVGRKARAALLGSEPAKRLLQIWLLRFEDENVTEWDDCFYGDHIKSINQLIPLVELIRTWLDRGIEEIDFGRALPEEIRTAYRLPMERESFVWAEPTSRRVVAKLGERRLYVAFDWDRRGVVPLAKYHRYDRVGDFIGEVAQAEDRGLLAARLPGFIVLLNCGRQTRTLPVPWLPQTGARVLPQAARNKDGTVNVTPRTAVVIASFPSADRAR